MNLKKSNYGRDYGWFIELDNEVIGELIDCQFIEMFWDSYLVKATSIGSQKILLNPKYWEECKFKFRNKETNDYVESFGGVDSTTDFCSGKSKRISMRSLYLKRKTNFFTKIIDKILN